MSNFINESVVKKPQQDEPLTEEQAEEWLKCALDKYYWMENYVYIQGDNGKQLFNPREYQKRVINNSEENRFTINLLGRQSGKCSGKDTKYVVRCKKTGETYEITANEFHELVNTEGSV